MAMETTGIAEVLNIFAQMDVLIFGEVLIGCAFGINGIMYTIPSE